MVWVAQVVLSCWLAQKQIPLRGKAVTIRDQWWAEGVLLSVGYPRTGAKIWALPRLIHRRWMVVQVGHSVSSLTLGNP